MTTADSQSDDQFEATIEWQGTQDLLPSRIYWMRVQQQELPVTITRLKYRVSGDNQKEAANILHCGETGIINVSLQSTTALIRSIAEPASLSFELFDVKNRKRIAQGQLNHRLRRATNIRWQTLDINKSARSTIKGQQPCIIWLTGFSGSGKSTIANLVEKRLYDLKMHSYLLDGDNVRHGLNKDLGFTDADRVENIRRIAETAKLMVDAGLIVLTSFISPFRSERQMARSLMAPEEFIEVFIDTPLDICEQRDPKGLYKKVRAGQIKNFTGFDSPYEKPENPELSIDTTRLSADQAADEIVAYLQSQS
jgi:bifunctional enzyme CysN/CysC